MNTQMQNVTAALSSIQIDIEKQLPKHITPEKFIQVCSIAAMVNPDLAQCSPASLAQAFIQAANDGLVPDGREAAVIVYSSKQGSEWVKKAQYQPMIDGVLKRLRQSGEVLSITAKAVYEGDIFEHEMSLDGETLDYRPNYDRPDSAPLKLVFAVARLKTGGTIVEVMKKQEIDKVMNLSKSAINKKTGEVNEFSVWANFYDRMALKTILHRIAKRLPNSSETVEILERDIQPQGLKDRESLNVPASVATTHAFMSKEAIDLLKIFVEKAGANEVKMFSWVSAKTGMIVNTYEELTKEQGLILVEMLDLKIKKAS